MAYDYDLDFIQRRYSILAKIYPVFELVFFLPLGIRKRAVERLGLGAGGRVLEVGCGTGRNLTHLVSAVGPGGTVYGVDYTGAMLAKARALCERHQWRNVQLLQQDAAQMTLPELVDGALFSLSYAVMPEPRRALAQAWKHLRHGGRLVIMDAKLPDGWRGKLVRPIMVGISRATVLGDPDKLPWKDMERLAGQFELEEINFGTYYIGCGTKPAETGVTV